MSNVAGDVALVILAGGTGSRLGGVDKARIVRHDITQLQRWIGAFRDQVSEIYICNRTGDPVLDVIALPDDTAWAPRSGPIAGLSAAAACASAPWLLSIPVDAVSLPPRLLQQMLARADDEIDVVRLVDQDGPQHLIALWRVSAVRERLSEARALDERAIWKLQLDRLAEVQYPDFHCGNLNTPADLRAFDAHTPDEIS